MYTCHIKNYISEKLKFFSQWSGAKKPHIRLARHWRQRNQRLTLLQRINQGIGTGIGTRKGAGSAEKL